MSDATRRISVRDLTPDEVAGGLLEDRILLVDVREPNETRLERFPAAVLVPMSAFDPASIPDPGGRQVVFACQVGRRSLIASRLAQSAGFAYDAHLAGGLLAWKARGHPTEG
jgi:rhodanese-related sulfurtransferase